MKKRLLQIIGILVFLFILYIGYVLIIEFLEERKHQAWVATLTHSASENVTILTDTVTIGYLNEKRTLSIYLPEGYVEDTLDYPVIYFLDGQSLFDQKILEGNEWQVDEVIDSVAEVSGQKAIVVGIYNSDDHRLTEYKPFLSPYLPKEKTVTGDQHAEWIVENLKPWVDSRYRTRKEEASTIIGGASLGGLMSYYMLMKYPDIFGGAIVFSPSFWVNDTVYKLHEPVADLSQKKIYFNAGELESSTVHRVGKMHGVLLKHGMPASNLMCDTIAGEGHKHMTWRKGFRKAFPWIITREMVEEMPLAADSLQL